MKQYTSDSKLANVLESNVPVLRNGRQVLAVKASQQNKVSGIVHEVSNTAHTVYIEPEEAVRCSNELIQKENELIEVIKRILQELTQALQPSIPLLKQALPIMILFDKTLASAKWGNEHNCCFAQSCLVNDKSKENKNESPILLQAKHPLLGDKAVPIDIRFLPEKRILIITGPEHGWKNCNVEDFCSVRNVESVRISTSMCGRNKASCFFKCFCRYWRRSVFGSVFVNFFRSHEEYCKRCSKGKR